MEEFTFLPTPFFNKLSSNEDFEYVGWGHSIVKSAEIRAKPYSSGFSTCIALLARSYLPGKDQPSQLGLAHVNTFESVQHCMGILRDMQKEISDGRIEVFIAGGKSISRSIYIEIHQKISEFAAEKKCSVEVVDDQFAIADINGTICLLTNKNAHYGTSGVSFAGFDKENNPVAGLEVHFDSFNASSEKPKEIVLIK